MKCGSFLINKIAVIIIIVSCSLSESLVFAVEIQSIDSIKQSASAYIAKQINRNNTTDHKTIITMGQLDRRLRLNQCAG